MVWQKTRSDQEAAELERVRGKVDAELGTAPSIQAKSLPSIMYTDVDPAVASKVAALEVSAW